MKDEGAGTGRKRMEENLTLKQGRPRKAKYPGCCWRHARKYGAASPEAFNPRRELRFPPVGRGEALGPLSWEIIQSVTVEG